MEAKTTLTKGEAMALRLIQDGYSLELAGGHVVARHADAGKPMYEIPMGAYYNLRANAILFHDWVSSPRITALGKSLLAETPQEEPDELST